METSKRPPGLGEIATGAVARQRALELLAPEIAGLADRRTPFDQRVKRGTREPRAPWRRRGSATGAGAGLPPAARTLTVSGRRYWPAARPQGRPGPPPGLCRPARRWRRGRGRPGTPPAPPPPLPGVHHRQVAGEVAPRARCPASPAGGQLGPTSSGGQPGHAVRPGLAGALRRRRARASSSARKRCSSRPMSSRRSRSGGTWSSQARSRCQSGARKRPAATASSKSRSLAAITRRSTARVLLVADRLDLVVFERPQQQVLEGGRGRADLVEEEAAAVGLAEEPSRLLDRRR